MSRAICGVTALVLAASAPSIASGAVTVNHPFTLNGGIGTRSSTSAAAVDASAEIDWTINITSVTVNGMLIGPVTLPVTIPLTDPGYGVSPANLAGNGKLIGAAPSEVFNRRYTLLEIGQTLPTYDFSVILSITADRKLQPTVVVHGLTQFNPFGVTGSPFTTPLSSVNVSGTATGSAVPAPAAAALPLMGLGLAASRRRRA